MTDLDERLTALLDERARATRVDDRLDAITGHAEVIRIDRIQDRPRRTRWVAAAAAAVIAAALIGVGALVASVRDDPQATISPAGQDLGASTPCSATSAT